MKSMGFRDTQNNLPSLVSEFKEQAFIKDIIMMEKSLTQQMRNLVCFSPNGAVLASGSYDNPIHLWDYKICKQIAKLEGLQFKTLQFENNPLLEDINSNRAILLISKKTIFQVQGASIFNGKIENQSCIDLKPLFKSKGSVADLQFMQI